MKTTHGLPPSHRVHWWLPGRVQKVRSLYILSFWTGDRRRSRGASAQASEPSVSEPLPNARSLHNQAQDQDLLIPSIRITLVAQFLYGDKMTLLLLFWVLVSDGWKTKQNVTRSSALSDLLLSGLKEELWSGIHFEHLASKGGLKGRDELKVGFDLR